MSTLGERLKYVFEHERIRQNHFAEKIGYKPSAISNYVNNRNQPDPDFFKLLKNEAPELNLNWLLAEDGEPFIKNELPGEQLLEAKMQALFQREFAKMTSSYYNQPQAIIVAQSTPPPPSQPIKRGQRSKTEAVCNNGVRQIVFKYKGYEQAYSPSLKN